MWDRNFILFLLLFGHALFWVSSVEQFLFSPYSVSLHFQDIIFPQGLWGQGCQSLDSSWPMVYSSFVLLLIKVRRVQRVRKKGQPILPKVSSSLGSCVMLASWELAQETALPQAWTFSVTKKNEMVSLNDHFSYGKKLLGPIGQTSCSYSSIW